ncbi:MAG TPA: M1 family metallopeptidase, partial [Gemmatimonadota bacterium]|nr:M1 family metallopeptidase [Gemmatimonadota bacterium]
MVRQGRDGARGGEAGRRGRRRGRGAGAAAALAAALLLAGPTAPAAGRTAPGGAGGPAGPRPAPAAADTGLVSSIPVFGPLVPPSAYRTAVAAGTRTERGVPGPSYWQQEVDYRIRASLVPDSDLVRGRETVTYVNRSPDSLASVVVHLYQNVYAPGVERDRTVHLTGGLHLERVEAEGVELREGAGPGPESGPSSAHEPGGAAGPAAGYRVDGTLVVLTLPAPLAPGDTARLAFAWHFTVPGPWSFRTGRIGHDLFAVAQWYPQVAVYDDVDGWDRTPYLGDGEFYLEYGDFSVELTLPAGWLVAATGTLENPAAVLRPAVARALGEAAGSDSVRPVVSAADRRAGRATRTGGPDGTLTWRFEARDVRDFAFSASDRYVWDAVGARVGGPAGRTRVDALYDPSISWWSDAARFEKHALEFYSRFIAPYPWPHAAAAFGPVGGMEYPMLVFIGRSGPGRRLYGVLAHELSHQWFPMQVGSMEAAFAWMDEGLTTFDESLAARDFFGDDRARTGDMASYLRVARAGLEAPLMQHTDHVTHPRGRVAAAYSKPATVLHALRTVIGRAAFDTAYARYARAWRYRHPLPWDFFSMLEDAAGRDLDWFWQEWFYRTDVLDQAVTDVRAAGDSARVTVENRGGAVMPVLLRLTTADGSTREVRWPADVWAGTRTVTRTVQAGGPVREVELDPDRRFPDVDRSNDAWHAG